MYKAHKVCTVLYHLYELYDVHKVSMAVYELLYGTVRTVRTITIIPTGRLSIKPSSGTEKQGRVRFFSETSSVFLGEGACARERQSLLATGRVGGRKKLAASAADDARYGMKARRAETLFRGSVLCTTARPRPFARERPFRYPCVTPTLAWWGLGNSVRGFLAWAHVFAARESVRQSGTAKATSEAPPATTQRRAAQ
jgi:hypothetical protein